MDKLTTTIQREWFREIVATREGTEYRVPTASEAQADCSMKDAVSVTSVNAAKVA